MAMGQMFRISIIAVALTVGLTTAAAAAPVPVDLSSWVQDGNGSWTLQSGNNAVFQSLNSPPTVFHNNINSQNTALSGTIEVQTVGDDDFVGFVLGYQQGDIDGLNASADYILVDWKQNPQSGQSAGMALSRITGAIQTGGASTGSDLWQHTGPVTELARANTLGNVGWADNTEYQFDITFRSNLIEVFVDGVLELSVTGTFQDGAFGFFNFSQPAVLYAGITEEDIPATAPPLLALFGLSLAGLGAVRRRTARA
jgi:hypothetical protein